MGDVDDLIKEMRLLTAELAKSHENNKLLAQRMPLIVDALRHGTDSSLVLRKDVYDMIQRLELREAETNIEKRQVGERLAKIETVMGIVERDVKDTGRFQLAQRDELEKGDSDRRIGAVVRNALRPLWLRWSLLVGGLGTGGGYIHHLLQVLHIIK